MPAENTGRPVALVTGVGPGTGAAIARRFSAGGYAVAMLARNGKRLAALEDEIENAKAFVCDVADEAQLDAVIASATEALGVPSVLVHNAVGGAFGNFLDIDPQILNRNFQVNTMALLYAARRLAPAMIATGPVRSSPAGIPRRSAARRISQASRRPRRRNASSPRRSRAKSGRRASMPPMC